MTGRLSLLPTNLLTDLLVPRHYRDGPRSYLVWLGLMFLPLSRTQHGLQHLYSTASLSIMCKSASWRIGRPPAEFIKNFTRNICEDDVYPFIWYVLLVPNILYCIRLCIIWVTAVYCKGAVYGFVNLDIPALHSVSY